jgi:mRNA interferase RelE/StbE
VVKYKISLSHSAERTLKKIPKNDLRRVLAKLESLTIDPFPDGCKKLAGEAHAFRVRVGVYRIIYDVIGTELIIFVLKIAHRKEAHR